MGKFNEADLRITPDGDLVIKDGDFELVTNIEAAAQNAMCRLKSSDPEWFGETICASLEDLLGKENNQTTGLEGEEKIKAALMADNLVSAEELYVKAVPVDKKTILYFVYINAPGGDPIGFEVTVNLSGGIALRRAG